MLSGGTQRRDRISLDIESTTIAVLSDTVSHTTAKHNPFFAIFFYKILKKLRKFNCSEEMYHYLFLVESTLDHLGFVLIRDRLILLNVVRFDQFKELNSKVESKLLFSIVSL